MNITFEPAKQEDLPLLLSLNDQLIRQYEDLSSIDYDKVIRWVEENLARQLPHFRRVIADGALAGFFCLSPGEDLWELDSLFILPPFQRKGIGTKVIEYCIRKSRGKLFLYVFRKNTEAESLYRRLGFQTIKPLPTRYIMEYSK